MATFVSGYSARAKELRDFSRVVHPGADIATEFLQRVAVPRILRGLLLDQKAPELYLTDLTPRQLRQLSAAISRCNDSTEGATSKLITFCARLHSKIDEVLREVEAASKTVNWLSESIALAKLREEYRKGVVLERV